MYVMIAGQPLVVHKEVNYMYPKEMVMPNKEELTSQGFEELLTKKDVEDKLGSDDTYLLAVNTVCGCAASSMRPAVIKAKEHAKCPTKLYTVFAGVDTEAVDTFRSAVESQGFEPSSPAIFIMKGSKALYAMLRQDINGRDPFDVADDLTAKFEMLS